MMLILKTMNICNLIDVFIFQKHIRNINVETKTAHISQIVLFCPKAKVMCTEY